MAGILVALQSGWLADASDLADSVALKVTSLADVPDTGGAVRRYAGGRVRWISTPGTTRKITLTVSLVDAATLAWIEAHKDSVVLLRDPTGRKRWCAFATFEADAYSFAAMHDVQSWDLYEVTHDESV